MLAALAEVDNVACRKHSCLSSLENHDSNLDIKRSDTTARRRVAKGHDCAGHSH